MAAGFEERIRPLRRAEYDQLVALGVFEGEKIELLEGVLVPMSPIGPPHSSTLDRLNALLLPPLMGRAIVRIQNPFAALDVSEPEPDVTVVPLGDYDAAHPDRAELIIEVSESSLARDRGVKLRLYAECAVPEYWIVNLVDRVIEVHTDPAGSAYRSLVTCGRGESIRPLRFPDLVIRVDDVIK
jgi:Uma2 family endonuclease